LTGFKDPGRDFLNLVRHRRHDFTNGFSDMIGDRQAIHLGKTLVDADIAQLTVEHAQADAGGVVDGLDFGERVPGAVLTLGERGLDLFSFADVDRRSDEPEKAPVGRRCDASTVPEPNPAAIPVLHPIFGAVTAVCAAVKHGREDDTAPVVGMHQGEPAGARWRYL
jgi:hypothetical protein